MIQQWSLEAERASIIAVYIEWRRVNSRDRDLEDAWSDEMRRNHKLELIAPVQVKQSPVYYVEAETSSCRNQKATESNLSSNIQCMMLHVVAPVVGAEMACKQDVDS